MPTSNEELGQLVERYQAKPLSVSRWIFLLFLLLSPLIVISIKLWEFLTNQLNRNILEIFQSNYPLLMSAYLLFLVALIALLLNYWHSKRFIEIYQHGVHWRFWGIKPASLLWSQVEGIAVARLEFTFLGRPVSHQTRVMLYLFNRPPLLIDLRSPQIEKALDQLKNQYYLYLFPRLLENFNRGQTLSFGPVRVQQESFEFFKRLPTVDFIPPSLLKSGKVQKIPWAKLNNLTVQRGFLVVQSGNLGTKRIPLSQIQNFELLLKIIEQGVNE